MQQLDLGLENKVAIVTGASKGIGYAIANTLALAGAKVLMVSRNEVSLAEAIKCIGEAGGQAASLAGDMADPSMPTLALEKANKLWGPVDILVNNAGGPPMGSFLEHDEAVWENVLQQNLLGFIRFTQAVAPDMKKNGWGRIISISSTVAKEPSPQMVLSATARAGLSAFTKAVSIELAPSNITVNVICPGGVLTDRLDQLLRLRAERELANYATLLKSAQESIPAQRFARPSEIADVALFLASTLGAYVTGVSLSVDGGLSKGYF
jgi:3-oxoacyl-[acyl-carrier protein] reductase